MDPTLKLALEGLLAAVCASAVHLLNDNNTRLRIGLPNWGRYLLAAVFGILGAALVADTANPGTFLPALIAAATVAMPAVMVILLDARTDTAGAPLQSKRPPAVPPLVVLALLLGAIGSQSCTHARATTAAKTADDVIANLCGTSTPVETCLTEVEQVIHLLGVKRQGMAHPVVGDAGGGQ